MPLESLLIKLKDIKFSGIFSLQIDPNELGAGNDDVVIANLELAKQYLYKYFEKS